MLEKKPFYIGWQAENDPRFQLHFRKYRWLFLIFLAALSGTVVLFQKPFNDHRFEFGQITQVTGRYFSDPFPMLIAEDGQLASNLSKSILLVGNGKRGAEGIMRSISADQGELNGKRITVSGTLIYGDGKTLLELTNEESSVEKIFSENPELASIKGRAPVALSGEIIDPKCYFGVMKPGEGKIHRSCAIRCISGGIPPVFRHETGNLEKPYKYYLMLDTENNKVNHEVLPFVAERINVLGNAANFMGWDIVYLSIDELHRDVDQ